MRKNISKRVRFEVFKRDGFACQYCGATSPDVILHVDHINPVAEGGDNDPMNLITSCEPCNLGKGAKTLDDKSAIAKQRAQLEELNERREQLEMMLDWRKGLSDLDDMKVDAFCAEFNSETGCRLNEIGRSKVKRWLKSHSLKDLLEGLDGALSSYYKGGAEDGKQNQQLAEKAFGMVVRVINSRTRYADRPYMRDLFYIRAIIRNRIHCNEPKAIALLERAYLAGVHLDDLKKLAQIAKSWTYWQNNMALWIEEVEAGQ